MYSNMCHTYLHLVSLILRCDAQMLFGETKVECSGIFEEECNRIRNRKLGSGNLKGCNIIRKWRDLDVGLKHYEIEKGTEINSKKEEIDFQI